mmetsp:Transcript_17159/g.42614  ORF Transcript_17159/g.42614 Transcript_17159/m.42614 type:complete len:217 (-) Transcript_17159:1173-1823(-)
MLHVSSLRLVCFGGCICRLWWSGFEYAHRERHANGCKEEHHNQSDDEEGAHAFACFLIPSTSTRFRSACFLIPLTSILFTRCRICFRSRPLIDSNLCEAQRAKHVFLGVSDARKLDRHVSPLLAVAVHLSSTDIIIVVTGRLEAIETIGRILTPDRLALLTCGRLRANEPHRGAPPPSTATGALRRRIRPVPRRVPHQHSHPALGCALRIAHAPLG